MDFRDDADVRACPNIRIEADPTIQSQYSASPAILALASAFAARIDPRSDISLFYREMFDIMTARGRGLDNWGRILGMGRALDVDDGDVFGFAGSLLHPFGQGAFHAPGPTRRRNLSDAAYRELLLFKAMSNISDATLATINSLLARLYPGRTAYALECGLMRIRVVFQWFLEPWQRSVFHNYALLNKGAGVGFEWYEIDPDRTFGFAGSNLQPFDGGVFDPLGVVASTL